MKRAVLFFVFIILSASVSAQAQLYGQYKAGDTKEAVANYDRSMRLNGSYYYIEPHFNQNHELFKIRIINHDYVVLADYHVVVQHAQRLVELMEYRYGTASRNTQAIDVANIDVKTPYTVAYWRLNDKDIYIDIECKDGIFYHIVFTISAFNLSTDKRSQMKSNFVEN